jgi:RND superfamily putative drug exporter
VKDTGMLKTWARVVALRPWALLISTGIFLILSAVAGSGVAGHLLNGGWDNPGSPSSVGGALLTQQFPDSRPNLVLQVGLPPSSTDVDSPEVVSQGRQLAADLGREPQLTGVTSYWQTKAPALASHDRRSALITARVIGDEQAVSEAMPGLTEKYAGTYGDLSVRVGGEAAVLNDLQETIKTDLARAELIALPITLLVLILVFRGLVAALLPLVVGIVAIVGTNAVLRVLTEFTEVSIFAMNLTTALGLGLAVDYALFIVRRYREELRGGSEPSAALATTLGTAGRTVLFSAMTVAAALSAMLLFPLYFLRSFAYAGISVVLLAAAAALVTLPALLFVLGRRIDALDLTRIIHRLTPGRRAAGVDPSRVASIGGRTTTAPVEGARWAAFTRRVLRSAPLTVIGTTAVLLLLGLPFLRVQFGTADYRQLPPSAASRQVAEAIAADFDAGTTGTIDIALQGTPPETVARYAAQVSSLDGVATVLSPAGTFRDGRVTGPTDSESSARSTDGVSYLSVVTRGIEEVSPQSEQLVRGMRGIEPSEGNAFVTGRAALALDTQHTIGSSLLPAGIWIALATLLLVFLLTGSVVVPVISVLINALSLTATFGAVVWVFQDGHLSGPLGFTPTGFVETALPVLMFCVAFGLSMDYGVFVLSRIKEEFDKTGRHRESIVEGLRRTGSLITAAALILAVVLVAIGTSRITNTKMLGLGVSLAIIVDAVVVRGVLLPAVLGLTGRWTWWAPRPLRRLHQRIGLSESDEPRDVDVREPQGRLQPTG